MKALVLALYAEGRTDERFLPLIIRRTAEQIILEQGKFPVDVSEPIVLRIKEPKPPNRAACVLRAACQAKGYHALVVHSDADDSKPERAMAERLQPGFDLVSKEKYKACRQLVPIIPIRMTEAWMLADVKALQEVIGTDLDADGMGIPKKAKSVENDADPKKRLENAVRNVEKHHSRRSRRRRRIKLGSLYEPLGESISLESLKPLSAYRRFRNDLEKTLAELNIIST